MAVIYYIKTETVSLKKSVILIEFITMSVYCIINFLKAQLKHVYK